MNETDYKGGILHLCIAFWLFITVHRLEIMLIWHGIWWSECSATKTVTGEKQKMTVSPSPLLLTSSCDTTQLHPSGTVMRQERTGLGLGAKLPSDTLGKVPKLSLYSPLVSLPPCVALIETPCWRGEQRAGQESCASHTGQDYRNQILLDSFSTLWASAAGVDLRSEFSSFHTWTDSNVRTFVLVSRGTSFLCSWGKPPNMQQLQNRKEREWFSLC